MPIEDMNIFKPEYDNMMILPNLCGIYIITANNKECLPELIRGAEYKLVFGRPIIYVGKSNRGIRIRDYNDHFNGTARRSTLRKSLGVLMGLTKKYEQYSPRKYKFVDEDEKYLSRWMKSNLWLHYKTTENTVIEENELIFLLNPPLNLLNNHAIVNHDIRTQISILRNE